MGDTVCLLIHGVAGGRYQMQALSEALKKAGVESVLMTIKGHEAGKKELVKTKYYSWLSDAKKQCRRLRERYRKVIVVGFSMGGLLALSLARCQAASAIVLINCPIFCVNLPRVLYNIYTDIRTWDFQNIRRYRKSDNIPLKTLGELNRLLEHTKLTLSAVDCPALLVQCADDDVVRPKSADYIYKHIKSKDKRLVLCQGGGHHIYLGEEKEQIHRDVARFVLEMQTK